MKIIAFIAAILSAATVATLAFTTVPSIQKQAADNAAAIEQNAEAIEQNSEAIETLDNIQIFEHHIKLSSDNGVAYIQFTSQIENYSSNSLIGYLKDNGFTDTDNVLRATGRALLPAVATVFGVYVSNDDYYLVYPVSDTLTFNSFLLSNASVTDISILCN